MKKSKSETAETRRRIVETAADALRRKGISGTSVQDLMSEAGLTHGGFYRHFRSKEQLVTEACQQSCDEMFDSLRDVCTVLGEGSNDLAAVADAFLSPDHRDDRVAICPFVSIGSELARSDAETRRTATESLERTVGLLAPRFGNHTPEMAEAQAIAAFSAMIGAVTLARIVDDPALSDKILMDVRALVGRMGDEVTP